ncbi:hypothetical protein CPB85DRAFT_1486134 [Mucidula mucida]|nr:hypothetical protein CPB85DRAFT_1486134 [Mucidula mucida]
MFYFFISYLTSSVSSFCAITLCLPARRSPTHFPPPQYQTSSKPSGTGYAHERNPFISSRTDHEDSGLPDLETSGAMVVLRKWLASCALHSPLWRSAALNVDRQLSRWITIRLKDDNATPDAPHRECCFARAITVGGLLRRPPNAPDMAQVGSGGFLIARQAITSTEEYWLKTFVLGAAFAALSSRHGDVFEFQSTLVLSRTHVLIDVVSKSQDSNFLTLIKVTWVAISGVYKPYAELLTLSFALAMHPSPSMNSIR